MSDNADAFIEAKVLRACHPMTRDLKEAVRLLDAMSYQELKDMHDAAVLVRSWTCKESRHRPECDADDPDEWDV